MQKTAAKRLRRVTRLLSVLGSRNWEFRDFQGEGTLVNIETTEGLHPSKSTPEVGQSYPLEETDPLKIAPPKTTIFHTQCWQ